MLGELVKVFFKDTTSRLAELSRALRESDTDWIERTAHALKGSSGNLGALGMVQICAWLEEAGTSGDLGHAQKLLKRLETEYERVQLILITHSGKGMKA